MDYSAVLQRLDFIYGNNRITLGPGMSSGIIDGGLTVNRTKKKAGRGKEQMLNFTNHMKKIIQLAEQSLVNVQAEKFEPAAENIMKISIHCNEAMQQLDELSLMKYKGTDPAERITE